MSTPSSGESPIERRVLVVAIAVSALLFLLAWLVWPTGPAETTRTTLPNRTPSDNTTAEAPASATTTNAADALADPEQPGRETAGRRGSKRGVQMTAPPGAIPPSTRPFDSPEAAASFVEGRVLELFAAVSPHIDPKSIHKTCVSDGRVCTFEGPWPGDDFFLDWLRAISEGRTGQEALDGVMFSEFKPVDTDGERRFVLTAHAP